MARSRPGEEPQEPTRAEGPPRHSRTGPVRAQKGSVTAGNKAALLADTEGEDSVNEESSSSSSQTAASEPLPESERPFGRYTLLRRLAYGGMGEIFLARQGGVGSLAPITKLVVIKRILSHMKRDEKHRKMFLDEARLQAFLANPHIVAIHDMGEENGHVFLAMEHVHGPSWRSVIDRCRKKREHIPLAHIASMVAQAARGLSYAHNLVDVTGAPLRIVHRDINPHNLLVNYDAEVKIIDFGIAKSELAEGQTETGTIKGKFSYMSPEQSAAMPLDHRSDIFALGICLYELIALDNPFRKSNVVLSLESIQRDTPKLLERRRRDAAPLQSVVDSCLAKERDDRFGDCAEIARVLDGLVTHGVIPHADKPLSTWLRELFADEIAAHVHILEQTGSTGAVALRSSSSDPSGRAHVSKRPPTSPVAALLKEHEDSSPRAGGLDVTSAQLQNQLDDDHRTNATPTASIMLTQLPPIRAGDQAEPTRTQTRTDGAESDVEGEFKVPSIADDVEPRRRARWPVALVAGLSAAAAAAGLVQMGVIDRFLDGRLDPIAELVPVPVVPVVPVAPQVPVVPVVPEVVRVDPPPVDPPPVDPPADLPPGTVDPPAATDPVVPPVEPTFEATPDKGPVVVKPKRPVQPKKPPVDPPVDTPKKELAGTLLVTSEGYQVKGNRKLALGESTTLVVDDANAPYALKVRARADADGNVSYDVETEPWAIVRVDGASRGKSPQRAITLPAGRRVEIELTNPKAGAMKLTLMLGGK